MVCACNLRAEEAKVGEFQAQASLYSKTWEWGGELAGGGGGERRREEKYCSEKLLKPEGQNNSK